MAHPQTVLVTGGASGIGLAIVRAVLAEGWTPVVVDLKQEALDRCARDLGEAADRAAFERVDISDETAVVEMVGRYASGPRTLTGVVNSAGLGIDCKVMDTTVAEFRRILDVNLIGSFVVAREVARVLQAHGGGSIVNISSVSGIQGNQGRMAYGASKAGVDGMTRIMASELADENIRVNAIAPGPIETPMVKEMHSADMRAGWEERVPMRRYGAPEEIASVATFLLDGAKSGYITGQTFRVDGGFTMAGLFGRRLTQDADPARS